MGGITKKRRKALQAVKARWRNRVRKDVYKMYNELTFPKTRLWPIPYHTIPFVPYHARR